MAGTFLGIEIAKRALMAHRRSLDVTSHNVGNANTPGYTRQVGVLQATPPMEALPEGLVGTGVTMTQIRRIHDAFTQIQLLQEDAVLHYWEQLASSVGQVERFLMEPTESGIGQALDWFWEAWNELAKRPESVPVREVVLERARGVADAFRHTRRQLHELRVDLNRAIEVEVGEVNTLAGRIAQLNQEIARVIRLGQQPNDLQDQRDLLLQDLAGIVAFTVEDGRDGQINVRMGDHMLVDEDRTYVVVVTSVPSVGPAPQFQQADVTWQADGTPVALGSSKLAAMVQLRDALIPSWVQSLDDLAESFVQAVNSLHRNGHSLEVPPNTGRDFFDASTPVTAENITLSAWVDGNPLGIAAASGSGQPGNGDVAKQIAELADQSIRDLDGDGVLDATAEELVESLLARVGSLGQEAQVRAASQSVLMNHLEDQRASVSGVSLDEELTNMLRFEHAYNASSRVLTAVDSMLEQLIMRTGRVGL